MIDLIIPYYNNPNELWETLKSIDMKLFNVYVIDDASPIAILPPFNAKFTYWRAHKNMGPGAARQYGIDHTKSPYIMFLDTGDIFISKEIQQQIIETIAADPKTNIFSWQYIHYENLTKDTDNRMHGKIYKREFIEKYDISFCAESSYLNEDIGFNRTCRIISDAIEVPIQFIEIPIIQQIKNEESLTQKDNQVSLYRDQTRALSLVTIHEIDICKKNNFNPEKEISQIAMALYYWFIRTLVERPEFSQNAWSGARIFYKHFENEIKPNQLISGNVYMKKCLQFRQNLKFPLNILRFTDEILKNENLPDKYLT